VGQKAKITIAGLPPGAASVNLVDRDGFSVRRLATNVTRSEGTWDLEWDGRLDDGTIAPDEAYSVVVKVEGARPFLYAPVGQAAPPTSVTAHYYDRVGGVLSYTLAEPSRVHIQAGSATLDPKTNQPVGPVLKTIANREPRTAGKVVETWNGMDESGTIRVTDLRNFRMAILATPLPKGSVITVGSRGRSFAEYALARTGTPLVAVPKAGHQHHEGLSALEDTAPTLILTPENVSPASAGNTWAKPKVPLRVRLQLQGPSTAAFSALPARVIAFVDQRPVLTLKPTTPMVISIPAMPAGDHIVAVNWATDAGPAAVNAFRIRVGTPKDRTPIPVATTSSASTASPRDNK
jgi:hypothetical protein